MAFDKEKVRQKIAFIGEKIGAEADPRLLNEYRLLFKKGFSFFRRSWAAAYLLMLYDQEQEARSGKDRGSFRSRPRGSPWEEKEKVPNRSEGSGKPDDGETAPRPFLPEEESRRLFISVGRNRHVFPREILGLIITRAQVGREDIGMIRILDSYSFVQVRDTVADRIIEALNGTVFRGRPMTANYARLKREEGS
ncbi:MAG: DbpA RNA binding domain-containing protein, partial [Treponema sp.]|nr:DbpA RNA binding domain-containing protein [Treponema sp.]